MNSELVKESLRKFSEVLSFNYPAVGWYFSSEEIENSFIFRKEKWVCIIIFTYMNMHTHLDFLKINASSISSEEKYQPTAG